MSAGRVSVAVAALVASTRRTCARMDADIVGGSRDGGGQRDRAAGCAETVEIP